MMVVLSMTNNEAELEAKSTDVRYSHEEVFSELRENLADKDCCETLR